MGDASPVFEGADHKRSRKLDGSALGRGNHAELPLKMVQRKVIAWNPSGSMLPASTENAVVLIEAAAEEPADFSEQQTVESGVMSTTNSSTQLDASRNSPVDRQQPTEVAEGESQQQGASDGEDDESEGWHEGDVDENGALEGFNKCCVPGHGTYEGIFHNGRPHGTGKLTKEDGTILDGTFDCGAFVSGTISKKGDIVCSGQSLERVRKTPSGKCINTHELEGQQEHVLEQTAAAAKAARRRGEEEAAARQRKQCELEKKAALAREHAAAQRTATHFMYHVGESRATPCRIRRGPNTTSDHVGTMYGATVPVTQVEGVWAKLHADAMALAKGSYGFSPFEIKTEGWIMLTTAKGVPIWEPAAGPMRGSVKVRLMD